MLQTVRGALDLVSVKAKAEKEQEEAKAKEKPAPTFHEKERARMAKMTDDKMANAQLGSQLKVQSFFSALHDSAHRDHAKALQDFKNLYGGSESKAQAVLMAKAMEEQDCHPVENRDIAFESKTLEANRPKNNMTKTDLAHYNILKDSLNEEWMKRGYRNTQGVIDAWTAKYK